jgi:hypothetical protein
MKLSQAILAGCKRRKQTTNTLFRRKALDGSVYSCALGAAYEGVTGEICWNSLAYDRLSKTFPILSKQARCPVRECSEARGESFHTLDCIIIHLNDSHGWSRERIALEVVKPKEGQTESGSWLHVADLSTAA